MLLSAAMETHSYVYNGSKLVQETVTTETITGEDTVTTTEVLYYAYDAGGNPLSVTLTDNTGTENTYYYATNLQGDVFAIFTPDGNAVVEYTYDAWGNPLTTTGTLSDTLGETNSLRYRGYVYDNETGYYYLQSRYYNPELGRFINADGLASTGQGLLGNNMFAYCKNSPVVYDDSDGTKARAVGAGIQLEFNIGTATVGFEIILYWDETVCEGGAPVVAIYMYYGSSIDIPHSMPEFKMMLDMILGDVEKYAYTLLDGTEAAVSSFVDIIRQNYSINVSGVLIMGNSRFTSAKDYEGPFISTSLTVAKARAAVAVSKTCTAISLGASFGKSKFGIGFSCTNYVMIDEFRISLPFAAKTGRAS